jgi:hypothetical protein
MLDALGYDGRKEVREYGKRWLVEIAFSAFGARRRTQSEEVPRPEGRGIVEGHAIQQVPFDQTIVM